MILKRRMKNNVICAIIALVVVGLSINISNADSNLEDEFTSFIGQYDTKNIIIENGISLRKGETLDLSKYPGWEMSNDKTLKIDENDILTPIDEGTVFLSNEIDGSVYVIEVYVSNKTSYKQPMLKNKMVNRDHYKVFIDAGHGGSDPGNVSYGYNEAELNLQIAKIVQKKLNNKNINIEVMMSRRSDKFIGLYERAKMANDYGADVFVSVHNNAVPTSTSASGIETFYHTNKSSYKPIASGIQNNAVKLTGAKDRGVKTANFTVLRETTMPSALFEGGFMTNKEEVKKLADPAYQDKLATAIANAVETYLVQNIELKPEFVPPYVSSTKILTKDIYKYDMGAGKYLTYINGKGYSQYSYVNKAESYAFIPSSWMKAVGLDVKMPTSDNGYIMQITNTYIEKVKKASVVLNKAKLGELSSEKIRAELSKIESTSKQNEQSTVEKSVPGKTLTKDIYKYDAGKGKYLTYINNKGYSQYSYLNISGNYSFIPSSWINAAGVDIIKPTSGNGYKTEINNSYMIKYNNIINKLNKYI